jgi:hypothetical protein
MAFSGVVLLMLSLGWSVTRPYLDKAVMQKIQLLAGTSTIFDIAQQFVMQSNESISMAIALTAIIPSSLLNAGMFYWIFSALGNIMETFQERRQLDKLALFQHAWTVLILAVLASTIGFGSEVFTVATFSKLEDWAHDDGTWKNEWIAGVGAPGAIYLCVVVVFMYLLAPFKGQLLPIGGAPETAQERKGDVDDVFAEDDDEFGKEDPSFWAGGQTGGKVAPENEGA